MIIVIPKTEKNNLYKLCNLIKQPLVELGEITDNKKITFFNLVTQAY